VTGRPHEGTVGQLAVHSMISSKWLAGDRLIVGFQNRGQNPVRY